MAKKKLYVRVVQLKSLWKDDERWQEHIASDGVADDYTLAGEGDEEGVETEVEFGLSEMKDTDALVYDFIGSEDGPERFYEKDVDVYKCKADGSMWVRWTEEIYDV